MFPELKKIFMLDPNITYLNHGSYGACPKPVFESLIQMKKKLEFEPTRFLGFDLYTFYGSKSESIAVCRDPMGAKKVPLGAAFFAPKGVETPTIRISRKWYFTPGTLGPGCY